MSPVAKKAHYLTGARQTCIDIGFGRLGTHLLGGGEDTISELLAQSVVIVGFDVGCVFEVRSLFEAQP